MKPLYLILILALVAITVLGLVILNDKQSVTEPVVDNNISTTTVSTVPSPLTLASLQALPDWNPTMEVEGMKRVEDNNPELEVKNLPIHTEEITSNNSSSTFVVKYLEPVISEEACKRQGLSTGHAYYGTYSCLESSPKLFNEIIITSKETGEVLHKYRLDSDYSFTSTKSIVEIGRFVSIDIYNDEDIPTIGMYI